MAGVVTYLATDSRTEKLRRVITALFAISGESESNFSNADDFSVLEERFWQQVAEAVSVGGGGGGGGGLGAAVAVAYAASITPDSDTYGIFNVATLTGPLTVNAPTGTPTDGKPILFRFIQDATGRAITWNAAFDFGTDFPSGDVPTTPSTQFEVLFRWNATSSKWRGMALSRGFTV